jgi:hypothetical protein
MWAIGCGKELSVTHYAAILILLLSVRPLLSQPPPVDDAQISSRISRTAGEFHSRTRMYGLGFSYKAGKLNDVLAQTRQQLLDDLPPDAAPLRAYVLERFPDSIPGVSPDQKINMKVCGPYLSNANDLFNSLKGVNAYRLDLVVESTPAGAIFELKPAAGDTLARASRGTLTNVWRGVYTYTVTMEGQKTITRNIDLVREKGNMLKCNLVNKSSPGDALPCDLVTDAGADKVGKGVR